MTTLDKANYAFDYPTFEECSIPVWDQVVAGGSFTGQTLRSFVQYIFKSGAEQKELKEDPPGAQGHGPYVGSLVEWMRSDGDLVKFFATYHEKYGRNSGISRVCLGHKVFYIVTDLDLAKEIGRNPKAFPRGDSLRVWRKFSPGGLEESERAKQRRRQAFHVLGAKRKLDYYLDCMARGAADWMPRLGKFADSGEPVDIMREAKRVALANTGASFFTNNTEGADNPFALQDDKDPRANQVIDALQIVFEQVSKRMLSVQANVPGSWGEWSLGDSLYAWMNPKDEKDFMNAKQTLKEVLLPIFQSFLGGNLKEGSHLAETYETFGVNLENPDYDELLDECLGFLQASFETAATALGATLMVLADNPGLQEQLRRELQELFVGGPPKDPKQLEKSPLLQQVVYEGLRLFPPIPFIIRDIEDPGELSRFNVQKGGSMIISPLLSQRDEKIWGNNAQDFIPGREPLREDAWDLLTFNPGSHACPGQRFAARELKLLIAWALLHFKLELANEDQEVGRSPEWSLTMGHGSVPVRFTRLKTT